VALSNTDPALRRAWHPVARDVEVTEDAPVRARLLGETWALRRLPGPGGAAGVAVRAARHRDGAAPAALQERDGLVFLAPEDPVTELLEVEEAGDPSFTVGWLRPVRARVGAGLIADNFLDMAHFPFVHAATIGTDEPARYDEVAVTREGYGMTVEVQELADPEDPGVSLSVRPLVQRRRALYAYRAPFMLRLRLDHLDAGGTNVVVLYVQPEDEQSCRLYCALYRDDLGRPGSEETRRRMAEAVRHEALILDEDLSLQTRYRDLRLPLDLRTEVHVRADRPTVELRRILADLVSLPPPPPA
jgi:phenylpropionate dioxygenase-like ring-hydroxylating dioxygenase large terminal subunit